VVEVFGFLDGDAGLHVEQEILQEIEVQVLVSG
jgi:hypothetical protein